VFACFLFWLQTQRFSFNGISCAGASTSPEPQGGGGRLRKRRTRACSLRCRSCDYIHHPPAHQVLGSWKSVTGLSCNTHHAAANSPVEQQPAKRGAYRAAVPSEQRCLQSGSCRREGSGRLSPAAAGLCSGGVFLCVCVCVCMCMLLGVCLCLFFVFFHLWAS